MPVDTINMMIVEVDQINRTTTFVPLMQIIEDNDKKLMGIPNESYQHMNMSKYTKISKYQKITKQGSDPDFTIPPMEPSFNEDQWPFQELDNHADINIQEGWKTYLLATDNSNNGKEVIIAVIDSGIDYTHPDLRDIMWKNPGETCEFNLTHSCEDNGIDDDNNGYVDDVYGVDFSGENHEGDPMDTHGHGTHCAGIIYAKPNGGGLLGAGVTSYTNGKVNA